MGSDLGQLLDNMKNTLDLECNDSYLIRIGDGAPIWFKSTSLFLFTSSNRNPYSGSIPIHDESADDSYVHF